MIPLIQLVLTLNYPDVAGLCLCCYTKTRDAPPPEDFAGNILKIRLVNSCFEIKGFLCKTGRSFQDFGTASNFNFLHACLNCKMRHLCHIT